MTGPTIELRAAGDSLEYVERQLTAAGLPTDDISRKPDCFYIAEFDGERVGVGGLEVHDEAGLLRSVAVEPDKRDRGLGTALVQALEMDARDAGVDELYLLTETAAGFFADRGYVEIDRSAAPAGIQQTTEFAELCSASAVAMHKPL